MVELYFSGGIVLSELDKVTTVKVYNWFANRRKDDKRRKHIGKYCVWL